MNNSQLIIAINTPKDYYFCAIPNKSLANLPGTSVYTYVDFRLFINRLSSAFPGTSRDLAERVKTNPTYIFIYTQKSDSTLYRPIPSDILDDHTMAELIKLYYKHVLNKTITID